METLIFYEEPVYLGVYVRRCFHNLLGRKALKGLKAFNVWA